MLLWLFALAALVASSLYLPLHSNVQLLLDGPVNGNVKANASRVLLLTAHPDDECFFFAPTILALQQHASQPDIYSLCLSVGDADGLGQVRKEELSRSLDVMGIEHDKRWVVDHPLLQDNMTLRWDASVIADIITPFVVGNGITTILTFDSKGISAHPNHYSLPSGASSLVNELSSKASVTTSVPVPRVFSLITVPVLPKYTGIISALLARTDILFSRALAYLVPGEAPQPLAVVTSGFKEYFKASRAIRQHDSQLVWFRYLYMVFSRYMWVNEWVEVGSDTMQ
ncbi:hypothetical protein HYDPIDRAFT_137542 [Hydnomerulius pinastri MD-312]|uniref:N-acetylglucosaminylphosphatidylinositol deacetylase n=1 Tax=Hydnomerulius pinastri MD-312 TaxID=994086 RepID=A0A0C9V7E8_9AGAM|nr:hypothetical protein HYDPIDRAFT_137542 [Hydnomerulius pinastri MD-312]